MENSGPFNTKMVSSKDAACEVGLTANYIAKICRSGYVEAQQIDGEWFVNLESLRAYRAAVEVERDARKEQLAELRRAEMVAAGLVPASFDANPVPGFSDRFREIKNAISQNRALAIAAVVLMMIVGSVSADLSGKGSDVPTQVAAVSDAGFVERTARSFFCGVLNWCGEARVVVEESVDSSRTTSNAVNTVDANTVQKDSAVRVDAKPVVSQSAAAPAQTIVQEITQPVVERVFETVRTVSEGFNVVALDEKLSQLENKLMQQLYASQSASSQYTGQVYNVVAQTNKIDQLNGVDISGGTISGASISGGSLSGVDVSAGAVSGVLSVAQGGTGTSTFALGDLLFASAQNTLGALPMGSVGQVLKVVGGTLTWATDITGSGGAGAFATSSDSLSIYPADPANVVILGASATSTSGYILEVAGDSLFRGMLVAYDTLTAPLFTATSTTATSTLPNFTATNARINGRLYDGAGTSGASGYVLQSTASGVQWVATTSLGLTVDTTGAWSGTFDGQEGSYYLANAFSTTSAENWKSQTNFYATTSADYWKTVNNFFSTTSSLYFASAGLSFSTTSATYFLTQSRGIAFSTTSADYWESQQGSRTQDDLTNNSIEDLNDVAAITENYGDLLYWNGSSWADIATSSLGINGGGLSFDYLFPNNATSTLLSFSGGIIAGASTTIGFGTQVGGLTISGGATTTGTTTASGIRIVSGSLRIPVVSCSEALETDSEGNIICGSDATATGAANDFTFTNNYGQITAATSSAIWAQSGIFASSTSRFANIDAQQATTTSFAISHLASALLATNIEGSVIATTSLSQNLIASIDKGFFFSTTSADAWKTVSNFYATTSADYWKSVNNFWSTTSAQYFTSIGLAWSTTSADAWKGISNFYSTTSANYWETQQAARTADDLSDNSIEDLQDVAAMTENYGDLLYWNGSAWADIATTSLGLAAAGELNNYLTLTAWYATTTQDIAEGGSNLYFTNGRVATYLATVDKGYFFSTTSADYFIAQNQGNAFSTTSADYWRGVNNFFSTSSVNYFSSLGLAFSTSSADAWSVARNFFSTSSASYFSSLGLAWATSSADYYAGASTTIPKTYTSNTFTGAQSFTGGLTVGTLNGPLQANNGVVSATSSVGVLYGGTGLSSAPTYGQVLLGQANGTYILVATSSLGITGGGLAFDYLFPNNATSTLLSFSGGIIAGASTTIGGGGQTTGLTISGGATTTGTLSVQGTGTSTFAGGVRTAGNLDVAGTGTSTFANGIKLDSGCFQMADGSCAGAGAGAGTVNAGTTGQTPYYAAGGTAVTATSTIFLTTGSNVGIGTTTASEKLSVNGNASVQAQGEFRFYDADSTNYTGFKSPSIVTSNLVYTLPSADGATNQQLITNGSGQLSWANSSNQVLASVTASEDIVKGEFVGYDASNNVVGRVSADYQQKISDNYLQGFGMKTVQVSDSVVLVIANGTVRAAKSVGADVIYGPETFFGSPTSGAYGYYFGGAKLNTNKAVLVWIDGQADTNARVATIGEDLTISLGAVETFNTDNESTSTNSLSVSSLDTDKAIISQVKIVNSTYRFSARVLSISGTTVTVGTEKIITGAGTAYEARSAMAQIGTDKVFLLYGSANTTLSSKVLSVSGSTITDGATTTVDTITQVTTYQSAWAVDALGTDKVLISYPNATSTRVGVLKAATISGSTITLGAGKYFQYPRSTHISQIGTDQALIFYGTSSSAYAFKATVSGTTISTSTETYTIKDYGSGTVYSYQPVQFGASGQFLLPYSSSISHVRIASISGDVISMGDDGTVRSYLGVATENISSGNSGNVLLQGYLTNSGIHYGTSTTYYVSSGGGMFSNISTTTGLTIAYAPNFNSLSVSFYGNTSSTTVGTLKVSSLCDINGANCTSTAGGGLNYWTLGATSTYLTDTSAKLAIGTSTGYASLSVWGSGGKNIIEAVTSASSSAFTVTSSGAVGIGTSTPWRTLSLNGTAAMTGLSAVSGTDQSVCIDPVTFEITTQAGDTCAVSSARYKHDIQPLAMDGLSLLRALNPVSFVYNGDTASTTQWGFIAEELASTSATLAAFNQDGSVQTLNHIGVTTVLVKAMKDMDLNFQTIASTTASSTATSTAFATSFFGNVFVKMGQWLADASNGIVEFFAKTVRAQNVYADTVVADEKICVDDQCLTKDDVRALIDVARNGLPAAAAASVPEPAPAPEPSEEEASADDTEAPVVTIQGNNPATIEVGSEYVDLGATVTDNLDQNMPLITLVDGVEVRAVSIDTSAPGEYVITYRATDDAGNVGEATRMVVVSGVEESAQTEEQGVVEDEEMPVSSEAADTEI